MLKEYSQVATSRSQHKELDIFVQSLVISVSKRISPIQSWKGQLEILSKIAEIQTAATYSTYIFGIKHKFTFFLETVPDLADYLFPIEETLRSHFIPAITEGHICSESVTCTSREILWHRIAASL